MRSQERLLATGHEGRYSGTVLRELDEIFAYIHERNSTAAHYRAAGSCVRGNVRAPWDLDCNSAYIYTYRLYFDENENLIFLELQ